MKIWHFIIIIALVAAPVSGIWLYFHNQRNSPDSPLFGEAEPSRIPAIFFEDPIVPPPVGATEEPPINVVFDAQIEKLGPEIFSDVFKALGEGDTSATDAPASPLPELPEPELIEEDIVAEP